MKKTLVLLGSVLMTGCFICHRQQSQKQVEEVVEQPTPVAAVPAVPAVPAEPVKPAVTRQAIVEAANFNFNSYEVRPDMNKVDEVEKLIAARPDAVVLLTGHTDNVGSADYNKKLSLERAKAVAAVLSEQGYPNEIRVSGAGDTAPIASNDTEEGRAQNRRVDVILIRE